MFALALEVQMIAVLIFEQAVAFAIVAVEPEQHAVRHDRARDRQGRLYVAAFAERHPALALELVRRILGDDVDGASDRACAVKRALRPFEHFDALDTDERAEIDRIERAGGNSVDDVSHRRPTLLPGGDATYRDQRDTGSIGFAQRDVRRHLHEIADLFHARGFEHRGAQHRDGIRHILYGLLAPA